MKFLRRKNKKQGPNKIIDLESFKNSQESSSDEVLAFDSGSVVSGIYMSESNDTQSNTKVTSLKSPSREEFSQTLNVGKLQSSPYLKGSPMNASKGEQKRSFFNRSPSKKSSPAMKMAASSVDSLSINGCLSAEIAEKTKEAMEQVIEKDEESKPKSVNYDVNPTVLYKFIEYEEWDEAISRCEEEPDEARTWVYRYVDYADDDTEVQPEEKKPMAVKWRMLPIHIAIVFKAPLNVVSALLKAYPNGINEPDDRKMLPIHLCCRAMTHLDVAQRLVLDNTDNLTKTDYKGRTPFDLLTEYRPDPKQHKRNTSALSDIKDRDVLIKMIGERLGIPDLDLYITKSLSVETTISSAEEKYNYELDKKVDTKKDYIERTPKNEKVEVKEADYDTNPTVLIKLIEKKMWEQAISRCEDHPGEAAIWMCRRKEKEEDVNSNQDVRWKILPIHSAIVLHAPTNVVEALVDAYPAGLRCGDDRNMLPLHMAFRLGSSLETTTVLVDAYPEALKKKDAKNHTPLHILKAYKKKYERLSNSGQELTSDLDANRKRLIRFYLGARKYGDDDDMTLAEYNSEEEEEEEDSDEGDSFFDDDGEDDAYDSLLYPGVIEDFGRLVKTGILTLPSLFRKTLSCNDDL
jgi:ankyrin repeat protein